MVICEVCGEEIAESTKFCPKCGSVVSNQKKVDEKPVNEETVDNTSKVNQTKFCTSCGTEVDVNAITCPTCGVTLLSSSSANQQHSSTKFCTNCGSEIDKNAVVCPKCGVAQGRLTEQKSAGVAIILSLFMPGLGHIYAGLTRKGLTFLIAYIIACIFIILIIGLLLAPVIWLWAIIDANKCVNALNAGEYVEDKLFI